MTLTQRSNTRNTLAGAAAICLWSTTIAFSRALTEQLGTLTAAAFIYIIAGTVGILLASRGKMQNLRNMLLLPRAYLLGCGALFVIYIASLYLSVGYAANRSQVLAVGLINYLWPGLSLAFSIPLLHRRARPWLAAGILLALAGVWTAVLYQADDAAGTLLAIISEGSLVPYSLALLAAVCWGLYTNLSRRWGSPDGAGAVPLFLLASGLLLGVMRLFSIETSHWQPSALVQLGYMALFPAMLAYVLWDDAVRKGNIILVATLSYLTPLLSTLISVIVLGVDAGPGLWIGTFLVMVGAALSKWSIPDSLT